jgi:transcriptional regulator with XRE-family HTH domain
VTGRQRREDLAHGTAAVQLAVALRVAREERGMSRATLADQAGVSLATLAKLEQQRTADPSPFTVSAVAQVLGCDLQELAEAAGVRSRRPAVVTAVSIGYEGRDQGSLISELRCRGVEVLADVRLNAVSRRPGFSKNGLRAALSEAGIEYRHYRALGNPQDNRAPFRAGRLALGCEVFTRRLEEPTGMAEFADLAETARHRITAVFCVERDERHCHRQVILGRLLSGGGVPV